MKPKAKKILIGVAVAAAVGFVAVIIGIDWIARNAIEIGATQALGVDTHLDDADIGLFTGRFGMAGLRVANPPQFDNEHFLKLGKGGVSLSLGSLLKDTVVLQKLELSGIELNLESKDGKGNYNVILDNMGGKNAGDSGDGQSDEKDAPKDQQPGKKFMIEEVVITDVTVHATVFTLGKKPVVTTLKIPEVRLDRVGSDSDKGVLMSKLVGILMKAFLEATIKAGADAIPGTIIKGLGQGLTAVGQAGEQAIKKTGEAVEKAGKDIEKGLNNVFEGIGKALEPKKKKEE